MSQAIAIIRSWMTGLQPQRTSGAARRFSPLAAAMTTTVVLSLYFWWLPGADLAVSAGFYGPDGAFPLSELPALRVLRKSSSWVLAAILVATLAALVVAARRGGLAGLLQARRAWCVLGGLILGPGLLVNLTLKSFWGRPRPIQIEMFGGDAPYVAPWRITDWCAENCSFVSGEGASAAWMVAAVALAPEPWRRMLLMPTATYAVALSLNRVAFGAHFISDVMLSWALTAVVMCAIHALLFRNAAAAPAAAGLAPARA